MGYTTTVTLPNGVGIDFKTEYEPDEDSIRHFQEEARKSFEDTRQSALASAYNSIPQGFVKGVGGALRGIGEIPGLGSVGSLGQTITEEAERGIPVNPAERGFATDVGSGIGQAASMVLGGAGLKALGAAGSVGRGMLGLAAAGGAGSAAETADVEGMTGLARGAYVATGGAIEAATEALGARFIPGLRNVSGTRGEQLLLSRFQTPAVRRALGQTGPGVVAKAAAAEGIEEVEAGALGTLSNKLFLDEDPERPGFTKAGTPLDFSLKRLAREGAVGAIVGGALASPAFGSGPKRRVIKDADGVAHEIPAGLEAHPDSLRAMGYDPATIADETAEEKRALDKYDLTKNLAEVDAQVGLMQALPPSEENDKVLGELLEVHRALREFVEPAALSVDAAIKGAEQNNDPKAAAVLRKAMEATEAANVPAEPAVGDPVGFDFTAATAELPIRATLKSGVEVQVVGISEDDPNEVIINDPELGEIPMPAAKLTIATAPPVVPPVPAAPVEQEWMQEALAERRAAGWDDSWPFVPADLDNTDFRAAIKADPSISEKTRHQILSFGRKKPVPADTELQTPEVEAPLPQQSELEVSPAAGPVPAPGLSSPEAGPAAPLGRDLTKPEQMTLYEVIAANPRSRSESYSAQGAYIKSLRAAIESRKPVSADGADTFKINLPAGYKKQGDLYVFSQGSQAKPSSSEYPAALPIVPPEVAYVHFIDALADVAQHINPRALRNVRLVKAAEVADKIDNFHAGVEGAFIPSTGEVILIADQIRQKKGETPRQAVLRVMVHEVVRHKGLAATFSSKELSAAMGGLRKATPYLQEHPEVDPEEYFAQQTETGDDWKKQPPLVRVWNAIRDIMRRIFGTRNDEKEMIRSLAKRAVEALRNGDLAVTPEEVNGAKFSTAFNPADPDNPLGYDQEEIAEKENYAAALTASLAARQQGQNRVQVGGIEQVGAARPVNSWQPRIDAAMAFWDGSTRRLSQNSIQFVERFIRNLNAGTIEKRTAKAASYLEKMELPPNDTQGIPALSQQVITFIERMIFNSATTAKGIDLLRGYIMTVDRAAVAGTFIENRESARGLQARQMVSNTQLFKLLKNAIKAARLDADIALGKVTGAADKTAAAMDNDRVTADSEAGPAQAAAEAVANPESVTSQAGLEEVRKVVSPQGWGMIQNLVALRRFIERQKQTFKASTAADEFEPSPEQIKAWGGKSITELEGMFKDMQAALLKELAGAPKRIRAKAVSIATGLEEKLAAQRAKAIQKLAEQDDPKARINRQLVKGPGERAVMETENAERAVSQIVAFLNPDNSLPSHLEDLDRSTAQTLREKIKAALEAIYGKQPAKQKMSVEEKIAMLLGEEELQQAVLDEAIEKEIETTKDPFMQEALRQTWAAISEDVGLSSVSKAMARRAVIPGFKGVNWREVFESPNLVEMMQQLASQGALDAEERISDVIDRTGAPVNPQTEQRLKNLRPFLTAAADLYVADKYANYLEAAAKPRSIQKFLQGYRYKDIIETIAGTPRPLQTEEWLREMVVESWGKMGATPEEISELVDHFRQFVRKAVEARIMAAQQSARRIYENRNPKPPPERKSQFEREFKIWSDALRIGVLDNQRDVSEATAKTNDITGGMEFTTEELRQLAEADLLASDPTTTEHVKALAYKTFMQIVSRRVKKPDVVGWYQQFITNNMLAGISTQTSSIIAPLFSQATDAAKDVMVSLFTGDFARAKFAAKSYGNSFKRLWEEFSFALKMDAYTSKQQAHLKAINTLGDQQQRFMEEFKSARGLIEKGKAGIKVIASTTDIVRRFMGSTDQMYNAFMSEYVQRLMTYDGMKDRRDEMLAKTAAADARWNDYYQNALAKGYDQRMARVTASDLVRRDIRNILPDQAEDIKETGIREAELTTGTSEGNNDLVQGMINDMYKSFGRNAGTRIAMRPILGFAQTAYKLASRSLDYSPFGFIRTAVTKSQMAKDVAAKDLTWNISRANARQLKRRFEEAVVGTVGLMGLVALYMAGDDEDEAKRWFIVNGRGPGDPVQRKLWTAAGRKPTSIQLFNERGAGFTLSFKNTGLENLMMPLRMVGAYEDQRWNVEPGQGFQITSYGAELGRGLVDSMRGLTDALRPFADPYATSVKNPAGTAAYMLTPMVLPFAGTLRSYNTLSGWWPDQSSQLSAMMGQIPVAGPFMSKPQINALGYPTAQSPMKFAEALRAPFYPQVAAKDHDLITSMMTWKRFPGGINRPATERWAKRPISDTEWWRYSVARGTKLREILGTALPRLKRMTEENRDTFIRNAGEAATRFAKRQIDR